MKIRVVILVTGNAAGQSAALAKEFAKLGSHYFAVDNRRRFAHLTLFDLIVKDIQVASQVKVSKPGKFILKAKGYYGTKSGYICVGVEKTKRLITFVNQLYQDFSKVPGRKTPIFKKQFHPHITLTRYKIQLLAKKVNINKTISFPVSVNTVALTLVDRHGQVYKIIKKFKLN